MAEIHKKFHKIYGYRTDKENWEEFVNKKEYELVNIKQKRNYTPYENKTGKIFGKLKVLYRNKNTWRCLCECGRQTNVYSSNLNSGKTKSCGCLAKKQF